MPNSDAQHLDALKTARDAIVAGMSEGRTTIRYKIGPREHQTSNPGQTLDFLEKQIEKYEKKVYRADRKPFRVASLTRPAARDC